MDPAKPTQRKSVLSRLFSSIVSKEKRPSGQEKPELSEEEKAQRDRWKP